MIRELGGITPLVHSQTLNAYDSRVALRNLGREFEMLVGQLW